MIKQIRMVFLILAVLGTGVGFGAAVHFFGEVIETATSMWGADHG